jgi:hypothetical protein
MNDNPKNSRKAYKCHTKKYEIWLKMRRERERERERERKFKNWTVFVSYCLVIYDIV